MKPFTGSTVYTEGNKSSEEEEPFTLRTPTFGSLPSFQVSFCCFIHLFIYSLTSTNSESIYRTTLNFTKG